MLAQRVKQWEQDWRERSFAAGVKQGIEQGERQTFMRQARLRYGPATADTLALLLDRISDTEQLAQIGEWIIQCEVSEDLLARVSGLLESH